METTKRAKVDSFLGGEKTPRKFGKEGQISFAL